MTTDKQPLVDTPATEPNFDAAQPDVTQTALSTVHFDDLVDASFDINAVCEMLSLLCDLMAPQHNSDQRIQYLNLSNLSSTLSRLQESLDNARLRLDGVVDADQSRRVTLLRPQFG